MENKKIDKSPVLHIDGRTLSRIRAELEKIESFAGDMKAGRGENGSAEAILRAAGDVRETLRRLEMDALSSAIDWNMEQCSAVEMKEEEDLRWLPF